MRKRKALKLRKTPHLQLLKRAKEDEDKDDEKEEGEKRAKRSAEKPDPDEETEQRSKEDDEDEDDEDKKKNKGDDKNERSVELIFSTGAPYVRRDKETGEQYLEILSMEPGAAKLDWINSGRAPLLNSHSQEGLDDVLGVIKRAWLDPKTNEYKASVRFSGRDDVDPVYRDVRDKIITSTSVGYDVDDWKDITQPGDQMQVRLATSWTPYEISLVGIPADLDSRVRKRADLAQRKESKTMQKNKLQTAEHLVESERKRGLQILRAAKAANVSDEFAKNLIEGGYSMSDASQKLIEEMAKPKPGFTPIINHHGIYPGSQDEVLTRRRGIENAILHKIDPKRYEISDYGRQFMRFRFSDYAELSTRGYGTADDYEYANMGFSPTAPFTRAFNGGTSDFPGILANVLNKELRRGFESAPATWQLFCRKVFTNNLKPIQRPQLGEAPMMEPVNQNGEYRLGALSETNVSYLIGNHGKRMSLPMEVLLDDDVNAFSRIPMLMGAAAQDYMSDFFYRLLCNNPKIWNGQEFMLLFDPAHNNVASKSEVIGIDTLAKGRQAFRQQKGQAGRVLNLEPKYLLLPSEQETRAEQILSQNLLAGQLSPNAGGGKDVQLANYNPFYNKLTPVIEPRLDAYSKDAWYLIADQSRIDVCEVAYLNGQETPVIISRDGFSSDGVEWRINHRFGFGFIEWRSWYQSPAAKK